MSEHAARQPDALPELDVKALMEAFDLFTKTTASMEESYRRLEERLQSLDQELQSKNQELALATDYLNSILDSMSDGVIAINTDGVITTFNRAAQQILGYAPDELIGKTYREVFGQQFSALPGLRAMELKARDGKRVPISEKTSPISDSSKTRLGSVKVFQDLREIEALREEVRRKDRLAAIGEMAATVAHEIRNPLGGVRGFANLLERDTDPADPRMRLIEKILAGVKNLDRVVNELLEYTRPVELDITRAPCRDLAESAIALLALDGTGITIRNEIRPAIYLRCDAGKLRQVLLNVLLNAKQSISGAGVITLTARAGEDAVTIGIRDTGAGIDPAHIGKLFSPFFTTKEKGTGLGLAVAAKIVESHGGTIGVRATSPNGSEFEIRLPTGES